MATYSAYIPDDVDREALQGAIVQIARDNGYRSVYAMLAALQNHKAVIRPCEPFRYGYARIERTAIEGVECIDCHAVEASAWFVGLTPDGCEGPICEMCAEAE